jgi:hypothetical protein
VFSRRNLLLGLGATAVAALVFRSWFLLALVALGVPPILYGRRRRSPVANAPEWQAAACFAVIGGGLLALLIWAIVWARIGLLADVVSAIGLGLPSAFALWIAFGLAWSAATGREPPARRGTIAFFARLNRSVF